MRAYLESLLAFIGHARARHLLVACGLLTGLVIAVGATLLIVEMRHHAISETERDLNNLALVLAEETDRSFQTIQLNQNALIEHMRELGVDTADKFATRMTSLEVTRNLQDRIAGVPVIDALMLTDWQGTLLNASHFWPVPPADVRDRDYFQALSNDRSLTSFISAPHRNRGDGIWVISYGRRFATPDGQLIGFVVSVIPLDYFEKLFARITVGGETTFALFRNDGILLARHPHHEPGIGHSYGEPATFARTVIAASRDVSRRPGLMDGKERLIAGRTTPHFPLIVTATDTVSAALGGWRVETQSLIGGTTLMELVITGIVVLGVRHLRSHEKLETANAAQIEAETARLVAEAELKLSHEREHGEYEAHRHFVRFETALDNMLQGLIMVDHAGTLLVVNRRFCELAGVPEDAIAPGMSYIEMTNIVVSIGSVRPQDLTVLRHCREDLIDRRSRSTFVWERTDGRSFTVTHQPMEEGWLTTYEDITERRQAEARIAHLAHHDALTDLPNRVLFHDRLERAMAFARRGHLVALHCLDLDQFKAVNDTLGHPIGDGLLREVARRLCNDLRETDTIARLGGDEFAIVQTAIESPIEATGLANKLLELIEAPFEVEGHRIVIGTSIGIAFAPQDGLDADQLLKCADLALYRAKIDGRGVYRLFQVEMDAAMQARRILELDLRQALPAGQLELFYQPLVDVSGRKIAGCEALLRWRHPAKGLVPPDRFIPLAEETGLIVPIGEWVLRQACVAAAGWPKELKVAVNLSSVQFKNHNLVGVVTAALRESGLHPSRLELEITETVMLQDTEATLATLHRLRELGIRIAMDDFGTGYSSLSYLRRFPFDRIKIDQSFVRDLGKRADCIAIVSAVTALGNDLGMAITAEGVETRQQLDTLERAGCTEVQGYLFSPAVPGAAVIDLLRTMPATVEVWPPYGMNATFDRAMAMQTLPAV